ncbi:hypothetical protein ACQEVG_18995 [Streptomyces sp. CA-135486]|uniref:hypothetical protein n=1 Tax=Streptomyces sp. CA-135486 TaxID=3240049 RepID=UPI003D8B2B7B
MFLQAFMPMNWREAYAEILRSGYTSTERLLAPAYPPAAASWTCTQQDQTVQEAPRAAQPQPDAARNRSARAMRVFHDLADWLSVSPVQAATLLGHKRNFYNWANGPYSPSPTSLAGINEAHALVEALVKAQDKAGARAWLEAIFEGKPRKRYLSNRVGRAELMKQANDLLFPPHIPPLWEPDEDLQHVPPPASDKPRGPLRTATRAPKAR